MKNRGRMGAMIVGAAVVALLQGWPSSADAQAPNQAASGSATVEPQRLSRVFAKSAADNAGADAYPARA